MSFRVRRIAGSLLTALIAFILFVALGSFVAHAPPHGFDLWVSAFHGDAALTAWVLTWALYGLLLMPLCIAILAAGFVFRRWLPAAITTIVTLLVSWAASDLFQRVFMRPRRFDWVVKHETAFSYPSTHAALAVAFYGFWCYIIARSSLPAATKVIINTLLGALILGVLWARLALGAHYPSDEMGGALLGLTTICIALAFCRWRNITLAP